MTFAASLNFLETVKAALWAPARRRPFARHAWAERVVTDGWLTLTEFSDAMETEDPRLYALARHMEEACRVFDLPLRYATPKPRSYHSNAMLFASMSAVDATALMIRFQAMGFTVDPSAMVALLAPRFATQRCISDAEMLVLFHSKSAGRERLVVITQPPPLPTQFESMTTEGGYRLKWLLREERARLEVLGPKFRPRKPSVEATCEYCGCDYLKGDYDSALAHRQHHERVRHSRDPRPLAAFAQHLTKSPAGDVVTATSPRWAHKEMYERAIMFKRDMGYDFAQWTAPPARGQTSEEGVGYLLVSPNEASTVAGACAFRQRAGVWTLDWAWLAPKYRRAGIMQRYWPRFVELYGDFELEHPLSDAMRAFVLKHATTVQQQRLQKHLSRAL